MNSPAATESHLVRGFHSARATGGRLLAALLMVGLLVAGSASTVAADGYTGSDSIAVSDNSVQPGQSIVVFASGFEPGSTVSIVLQPGGVVLDTATADSRGRVEVAVVVPAQAAVGNYRIEAIGVRGQQPVEHSIAVAVTSSGRPLPSTGGNLGRTLVLAAACVGVGAFIVLRFRHRRAA